MTANFYLFKLTYYHEYDEKEETCQGILAAESFTDACAKINSRFGEVYTLTIEPIFEDWDFIFTSENIYQDFRARGLDALTEEEVKLAAPSRDDASVPVSEEEDNLFNAMYANEFKDPDCTKMGNTTDNTAYVWNPQYERFVPLDRKTHV